MEQAKTGHAQIRPTARAGSPPRGNDRLTKPIGQPEFDQRKSNDTSGRPPMPPNCEVSGTGSAATHGAFVMECCGEHPYTIKVEGKQTGTTMEGTMDIIMGGTEIKQAYSGKRIGSCDVAGVKNVDSAGGLPSYDRRSMMQQDGSPPPWARDRAQRTADADATPPATEPPPTPGRGKACHQDRESEEGPQEPAALLKNDPSAAHRRNDLVNPFRCCTSALSAPNFSESAFTR